jgi:hypothetical protein
VKRQQLYRSLPELLCELTPLENPEGCHLNVSRRVNRHPCTALTILAGDRAVYLSVEYLAITEFTGIYLSMAPYYIHCYVLAFKQILIVFVCPTY